MKALFLFLCLCLPWSADAQNDGRQDSTIDLSGVTIVAKRVAYNSKGYSVNLSTIPLFQSRTLAEAMQMLPGLTLKDNKFYAYGNDIGSVFVDNKRISLTGTALTNFLNNYDAKNIASVEILNRTADPTLYNKSQYVLKITTVKSNTSGQLTAGVGASKQSIYDFNVYPIISLQQTIGKWSFYLMPDYSPRTLLKRDGTSTTDFYDSGLKREEHYKTRQKNKPDLSFTAGVGYNFDKNNTLSITSNGNFKKRDQSNATTNDIFEANILTSATNGVTTDKTKDKRIDGMVSYLGRLPIVTINAYFQYAFKNTEEDESHHSTAYNEGAAPSDQRINNIYRLYTFNGSAKWKLAKAHSVSTSFSMTKWENNNDYTQSADATDPIQQFKYKEKSFNGSLEYNFINAPFDIDGGIRMTRYFIEPLQVQASGATSYKRNLTEWLPFATLSYMFNQRRRESITVFYERQYHLQQLSMMMPAAEWQSEYSYSKGNPGVNPDVSDNVAVQVRAFDFTMRLNYTNYLGITRTYDVDDNGDTYYSYFNGMHSQDLTFLVYPPVLRISPKWRINTSCSYQWSREHYLEQKYISRQFSFSVTSMTTLPGKVSLLLTLQGSTPEQSMYASTYRIGKCACSLRKTFLKGRLNTALSLNYWLNSHSTSTSPFFRTATYYDKSPNGVSVSVKYDIQWGKRQMNGQQNIIRTSESVRM